MVLVPKWPFSNFFFFGIISQESVFYYILECKTVFLGDKNRHFKKSKNWDFSKGVNPCFWSKNGHFSNFFSFGNISQAHVFNDIVEGKNAFPRYKNKKFKKSKNWDFSKRINPCFWSKNGHFSNFFSFCNISQEHVFNDIVEGKNAFPRYKNKKFKKSKNWDFSKRVNPCLWSKNGHFSNLFLF